MRRFLPLILLAACTTTAGLGEDEPLVTRMSAWAGECWGLCIQEVAFAPDGTVHLDGRNWDDTVYIDNHATLTDASLAELRALEADLYEVDLEPVYGCPDCADGGGVTFARWGREVREEATTDYPWGEPPEALQDIDAFFFEVLEQLKACEGDRIEAGDDCEPFAWE